MVKDKMEDWALEPLEAAEVAEIPDGLGALVCQTRYCLEHERFVVADELLRWLHRPNAGP
jgi:hypothetical protein